MDEPIDAIEAVALFLEQRGRTEGHMPAVGKNYMLIAWDVRRSRDEIEGIVGVPASPSLNRPSGDRK